jgi:hypothetical protein
VSENTQKVKFEYRFIQSDQFITLDCTPPDWTVQRQLDGNFWMWQTDGEIVTKLYSALTTGLRLEYPDEEQQLLWNFWESFACMELCTAVLQSFANNVDCQQALVDLLGGLGFSPNSGGSGEVIPSIAGQNLNMSTDCTDDGTYAVAYAMAGMLNTVAEDFLDIIQDVTSELEMTGEVLDNIPLIGSFIATAIDIASYLINEAQASYLASWTTTIQDNIACEIWQYMCDDCEITLDEIAQAYRQLLPTADIPTQFADWVQWAAWFTNVSPSSATQTVAVFHFLILTIWRMGSQFGTSTHRLLQIASQQAGTLSPPVECECGGAWGYEWDFTTTNGQLDGWLPTATGGTYTAGVGYTATKPSASYNTYLGMADIGEEINLTAIEFECIAFNLNVTNNAKIRAWQNVDFTSPNVILVDSNSTGDPVIYTWNGNETGIESMLMSVLGANGDGALGNTIKRIALYGRGTRPAWTQGMEL